MPDKKILIIEDQADSLRSAFDIANALDFNGSLQFEYLPKSQDVNYNTLKDEYELIFVDITLAIKSEMNGFGIIKKIVDENLFDQSKLFILTGNSQVEEGLEDNGISVPIPIITKPVTFKTIGAKLKKILNIQ